MIKEIVVFANSVKHGNSCVAGKCMKTGEWIRPVSNDQGGEISNEQTVKVSGYRLQILDKVKVDLSHHAPLNHQTENYVINKTPWTDEFFIKKEVENKITETKVVPLNEEERVREIARMISGDDYSDISIQHAKEILGV